VVRVHARRERRTEDDGRIALALFLNGSIDTSTSTGGFAAAAAIASEPAGGWRIVRALDNGFST
jgi:hypothetical protein